MWVQGVGWNLDTTYWTNRDLAYPEYVENAARMAYDMAGVTEPRKQIHVAEPYDPFDYKELHHLEGLLLFDKGKAPEAARDGVTARDGDLPCCPSGGLLGVGNPIAAAGLMKIAELFWQLRGEAGARQVPGTPERGVAQAWGDLMQVGTVVVMGTDGGPATTAHPPGAQPADRARGPTPLIRRGVPQRRPAPSTTRSTLDLRVGRRGGDGRVPRGHAGRADRRHALRAVRTHAGAAADVLRALLPAHRRVDRGRRRSGTVETFSICHVPWDMQPLDPPEIPAVIRLDGASEGGFLHKLGEVAPDDVRDRHGGRGRVAARRGADGFDPGHRVLPSASPEVRTDGAQRSTATCRCAFRYTPGVGEHRVLRGAARPRRAAGLAMRGVRRHVPARADVLRALLRRAHAPTPSAVRAARSSRSRSGTSASTVNRWTSPSWSPSCSSTAPTPS